MLPDASFAGRPGNPVPRGAAPRAGLLPLRFAGRTRSAIAMKYGKTRDIVFCGLFIALITLGTFIRIPIGNDFYTLQFLFTLLAGLVLGPRLGALAVGAYVLLGLLGVPVFASGGGPGYLAQPTFGYLVGFIVQAWFCGAAARRWNARSVREMLLVNLGGMAIVYFFGLVWFYISSNFIIHAPVSVWWVILYCGILQVGPDFVLCVVSAMLAARLESAGLWLTRPTASVAKP